MTGERRLQDEFQSAFVHVIGRAVQVCGYLPDRYVRAAHEQGALTAVKRLLAEPVSDDSLQLWARGRKDLTIEALARCEQWRDLFAVEELEVAEQRLAGWRVPSDFDEIVAELVNAVPHPFNGEEPIERGE